MTINLDLLVPFIGAIAAFASVLIVYSKWLEEQDNDKHDQLRREIRNEIRAEIYRDLLELNVQWLSQSETRRNTVARLSDEETDSALESRSAD